MFKGYARLAVIFGLAGAFAVVATAADAKSRKTSKRTNAAAAQTFYPSQAYPRSFGRAYGAYGMSGGGINFGDGRNGANWNPNQ